MLRFLFELDCSLEDSRTACFLRFSLCSLFLFSLCSSFFWSLLGPYEKKIVVELKSGIAMLFSVGTTRNLPICVLRFFFYFLFSISVSLIPEICCCFWYRAWLFVLNIIVNIPFCSKLWSSGLPCNSNARQNELKLIVAFFWECR